jgi:protein-L-isoaspartate(D-aspartate) O-methyltransferase
MGAREREALLDELRRGFVDLMIVTGTIRTDTVRQAFLNVPRHLFVDRYYDHDELVEVDPDAPAEEQLRRIYGDEALVSHRRDGTPTSSTSQPNLVAQMLEQLLLEEGMNVLEIGAGTGWNAALMGHAVGPRGRVVAVDIQEDVTDRARAHLKRAGATNVTVVACDGGYGYPEAAPYDRIITTANCHGIPPHWAEQLAPGGALLVALRDVPGSGMCLHLRLRRRRECLSGEVVGTSGFMTLRGDFGTPEVPREEQQERAAALVAGREPRQEPALWSRPGLPEQVVRRVLGDLVFFAQLEGLQVERLGERYGLVDPATGEACVTDGGAASVYGGEAALRRLREITRRWVDLGAPRRWSYSVEAWPPEARKRRPRNGWLLRRPHTQLVLRLKRRTRDCLLTW